jgi:hypothetical protein
MELNVQRILDELVLEIAQLKKDLALEKEKARTYKELLDKESEEDGI